MAVSGSIRSARNMFFGAPWVVGWWSGPPPFAEGGGGTQCRVCDERVYTSVLRPVRFQPYCLYSHSSCSRIPICCQF
jgi:hypothetical protein